MKEEEKYKEIALRLAAKNPVVEGQMFGKQCLKNKDNKAFAAFFKNCMVFKLEKKTLIEELLSLPGAERWDPSGKRMPMKQWVQLPYKHAAKWEELAATALKDSLSPGKTSSKK